MVKRRFVPLQGSPTAAAVCDTTLPQTQTTLPESATQLPRSATVTTQCHAAPIQCGFSTTFS